MMCQSRASVAWLVETRGNLLCTRTHMFRVAAPGGCHDQGAARDAHPPSSAGGVCKTRGVDLLEHQHEDPRHALWLAC